MRRSYAPLVPWVAGLWLLAIPGLPGCGGAGPIRPPAVAPDAQAPTHVLDGGAAPDAGAPVGSPQDAGVTPASDAAMGISDAPAADAADAAAAPDPASAPCTGWGAGIRALASAPAAHLAAAGFNDGSITVWNDDLTVRRQFPARAAAVRTLALADDGSLLATADQLGRSDDTATVWSVATGQPLWTLPGTVDEIVSLAFSPDHRFLLAVSYQRVRVYEVAGGKTAWSLDFPMSGSIQVFFTDAGANVVVQQDDDITVRRRDSGQVLRRKTRAELPFTEASWIVSPAGDLMIQRSPVTDAGPRKIVRISDLSIQDGSAIKGELGHPLFFSADGSILLTSGYDTVVGTLIVPWRTSDWTQLTPWSNGAFPQIARGPHAGDALVTDALGRVSLVDAATGQTTVPPLPGRGQALPIVALRFSPDGTQLVSQAREHAPNQASLIVWSSITQKEIFALPDVAGSSNSHAFSSDGKSLFTVSSAGTIRVHEAGDGRISKEFGTDVFSVLPGPGGQLLFAGGKDKTLRRYRIAEGTSEPLANLHFTASALALSPRGALLAASGRQGRVVVHRTADGSQVWEGSGMGPGDHRSSLAFSPDGKFLVVKTGIGFSNLFLYDAETGAPIPLRIPYDARGTVDVSSRGDLLAVGALPGVQLIRLADQQLLHTIPNAQHRNSMMAVAFSPVRDQLVTGLWYGRIDSHCGLVAKFAAP